MAECLKIKVKYGIDGIMVLRVLSYAWFGELIQLKKYINAKQNTYILEKELLSNTGKLFFSVSQGDIILNRIKHLLILLNRQKSGFVKTLYKWWSSWDKACFQIQSEILG